MENRVCQLSIKSRNDVTNEHFRTGAQEDQGSECPGKSIREDSEGNYVQRWKIGWEFVCRTVSKYFGSYLEENKKIFRFSFPFSLDNFNL